MSWEIDKLGNYSKVISGYAFKSDSFRTDNGIPIIKIKNIQREYVEIDGEYFVDTSYLSLDPKFHCIKDDILISLTGSHITLPNSVVGRVAKYHYDFTSLLNQRGGKIVVTNPDKLENNYLYYYLCQNEIRIKLAQFGRGGANQCNISPSNVESIPILLPPLQTQKRIASILSAYDDLIENNLKRIKLLEETAQNIYKEWFVHFRFPNYEHTELDAESGLPKGWEMKKLSDLYNTSSGGTPKRDNPNYYDGNIKWFRTNELQDNFLIDSELHISDDALKNSSAKLFPKNTVLMAMYGATIGRLGVLTEEASTNQACCGIIPISEEFGNSYIYYWLLKNREHILSLRMGAAQENISQTIIKDLDVLKPHFNILKEFNSKIDKINELNINFTIQNQKLKEARDILLPRLMNRTIEV
jgi:type I restriction enzyme S subunit